MNIVVRHGSLIHRIDEWKTKWWWLGGPGSGRLGGGPDGVVPLGSQVQAEHMSPGFSRHFVYVALGTGLFLFHRKKKRIERNSNKKIGIDNVQ
jgi:hypothetical protein